MHRFEEPYPLFLQLLDSDPSKAMELFWESAQRQLKACPPSVMRSVSIDNRADVISDVIMFCIESDFRVLRQYSDRGRPFAAWFMQTARRRILRWLRDHGSTAGISGAGDSINDRQADPPDPHDSASPELRRLVAIVNDCILELKDYCQLLIRLSGEEFKPREIALVLGPEHDDAVKISEDLRQCRKKLLKMLGEKGIELPLKDER